MVHVGTGQLADTPTGGLPTRGLDNSRTGHLADWSTRGLDNSRTGQVADWTTRGCHRRLCVLSFPFWRHLPDRELSSSRVEQSVRCPVRELAICELAYPRVVQLPCMWTSVFFKLGTKVGLHVIHKCILGFCSIQISRVLVRMFCVKESLKYVT